MPLRGDPKTRVLPTLPRRPCGRHPFCRRGILHRIRSEFPFHGMENLDRNVVLINENGIAPS